MEFHFSLSRVGSLKYSCPIVILCLYLVVQKFVLQIIAVVVVMVVVGSFKVQKDLVENFIWLFYMIPLLFSLIRIILLLILMNIL